MFGGVARLLGGTLPFLAVLLLVAGCESMVPLDGKTETATKGTAASEKGPAKPENAYRVGTEGARTEPLIVKGTGEFTGPAKAHGAVGGGGGVTLNFVDANLREVVRSIMSDVLGLNYILDPGVEGKVTLQTSRPLPRAAVLPALENILQLNGAALVESDGMYRVVKADRGARGALLRSAGGGGIRVRVMPLRYVGAGDMERILQPFLPNGAVIQVDSPRNLLLVAGTRQDLSSVTDMVEVFDVDWLKGMSFGLFPLTFADASALVTEIQAVFANSEGGPLEGLLKFVPIERLNALLVVSQQPDYVERAKDWITRLDQRSDGGQSLHVYRVQNGRAVDLAQVLGQIFGAETGQVQGSDALAPGVAGASLTSDLTSNQRRATPAGAGLQTSAATQAGTATESDVSRAARRSPATRQRATGRGRAVAGRGSTPVGAPLIGSRPIRIIAEERTNTLVILATPADYKMVEAALRRLDTVPLQVLIEATIAEVTLTDDLQYGLQWFFQSGHNEITLSELASNAIAPSFPGFSYFFNSADIKVALSALESVTDVNVISSPQLMVLNNGSAMLQVGDQVPIATQSAVSITDPDAPIVNSIQFRDTGVILRVTPRVNAGGLVILDIEQESSDVTATTTSGIDSPTIQQRRLESTLAVQSGETVALGGMIKDRISKTNTGVPVLKDIPLFGNLFSKTKDTTTRTELLVLITPRVVSNQQEARDVTKELQRKLRAIIPLEKKIQ